MLYTVGLLTSFLHIEGELREDTELVLLTVEAPGPRRCSATAGAPLITADERVSA